jgi:hypothetical protein
MDTATSAWQAIRGCDHYVHRVKERSSSTKESTRTVPFDQSKCVSTLERWSRPQTVLARCFCSRTVYRNRELTLVDLKADEWRDPRESNWITVPTSRWVGLTAGWRGDWVVYSRLSKVSQDYSKKKLCKFACIATRSETHWRSLVAIILDIRCLTIQDRYEENLSVKPTLEACTLTNQFDTTRCKSTYLFGSFALLNLATLRLSWIDFVRNAFASLVFSCQIDLVKCNVLSCSSAWSSSKCLFVF